MDQTCVNIENQTCVNIENQTCVDIENQTCVDIENQNQNDNQNEKCGICLINFDSCSKLNLATLDCGHKFHYKCVGKWSRKKTVVQFVELEIFDDEDFQSESDTESDSNDEDAIHITDLEASWNPPNNNNLNHDSDSNEEHLIVNNLMEYYSSLDRFYNDIQNFEDVTDTVLRRIQNTNVIVNITCVDCNKNLKNCEACGDFTCGCSNDHNHYNGKNPFYNENVQDLKVTCKKCFERRETMLSTYI